jgi:hypothetical protein
MAAAGGESKNDTHSLYLYLSTSNHHLIQSHSVGLLACSLQGRPCLVMLWPGKPFEFWEMRQSLGHFIWLWGMYNLRPLERLLIHKRQLRDCMV